MTLLDKLMFWKKEEALPELPVGKFPELETPGLARPPGLPPAPGGPGLTEPPSMGEDLGPAPSPPQLQPVQTPPAPRAFSPSPAPAQQGPAQTMSQDSMQVINAKLDTLKALIENMNIKLDRMEKQKTEEEIPVAVRGRWR